MHRQDKSSINILDKIADDIINEDIKKEPQESVLKTEFKIQKLIIEINNKESQRK